MTLRAVRAGELAVPPLPTPEVINQLPIEALPALVVQLAALQALAGARLALAVRARPLDRLLGLEEAAARLATTPDWLARQKRLPFRVELSPGQVRWSEQGLTEWITSKRGARDI